MGSYGYFSYYVRFNTLTYSFAMPFQNCPRNIWLLCLAQVFAFTSANVTIFLGGIIGSLLTPSPALATMPVASMVVGMASGTVPASLIMSKKGRRFGFIGAAIFASGASLMGALAIDMANFWAYCLACFCIGLNVAFVQQYRFAAAESVLPEYAPTAISYILLAGIAGAFLGPNVANLTKNLLPSAPFVGSYIALAVMVLMPALILSWLTNTDQKQANEADEGRSIKELAKQPNFILAIMAAGIGYGIMSFVMTATPISMHVMDGHSLYHTGVVIQWHIVGMFLPSLFTGKLIRRYGHQSIMLLGILALLGCVIESQFDQSVTGYWVSLVLLGIGWNFLFITGTALLINCYRNSEKYRAQAANDFMVFGFQALASLSAGWLLNVSSWKIINIMSIPLLFILLLTILWARRQNGHS